MNWTSLSSTNAEAADVLIAAGHWRSSINRAYYSAYAGTTAKLSHLAPFRYGWNNPHHSDLPNMVDQVKGLAPAERKVLKREIKQLFRLRVQCDYFPAAFIDREHAKSAYRRMTKCLEILGVPYEP